MVTCCAALQGTDAGAVILGALNETRQLPLEEQVTLFVPTNAAFSVARDDFYSSYTYLYYLRYTDYAEELSSRPVDVRSPHPPSPSIFDAQHFLLHTSARLPSM